MNKSINRFSSKFHSVQSACIMHSSVCNEMQVKSQAYLTRIYRTLKNDSGDSIFPVSAHYCNIISTPKPSVWTDSILPVTLDKVRQKGFLEIEIYCIRGCTFTLQKYKCRSRTQTSQSRPNAVLPETVPSCSSQLHGTSFSLLAYSK